MSESPAGASTAGVEHDTRSATFVNWPALYREMDRERLDALVAATPEGTFYLAGIHVELNRWFRDRLALVVVPRQGTPTFIVCNIEEPLAKSLSWIDDIRTYAHYVESVGALAQVLEEKQLSRGRIGFEEKFWSTTFHRRVAEQLPRASLVGADAVIDTARARKMPAEVALLQEAARLSDEAARSAWMRCRAGTTEHELAIDMTLEMLARGAPRVAHLSVGSGMNTRVYRNRPGDKSLDRGELVLSAFGAVHKGYWADVCRMGVVGEPSSRQRERYQLLRDVHRAMIARMKPGVRCDELYEFARDAYAQAGVDEVASSVGHSMPRARGHEPPELQPRETTGLEPNMVFAVEPSFLIDAERYQLRDLVQVTESEPMLLSDSWDTEELFIFR